MRRKRQLCLLLLLLLLLLLCACGGEPADGPAPSGAQETPGSPMPTETVPSRASAGTYTAPPFADAVFRPHNAEGNADAMIDLSSVSEGYVAVSAVSDTRLKLQVIKDDITYNYDMASDGTPSIFPLQCGNGSYRFRFMKNVTENKYTELYAAVCDVTLADEFQPFLRPNDYVPYKEDSACVKKAASLAEGAGDELEVVSAVYDYICTAVTYDAEKARSVQSGYLPDPDETMATGQGICFDYASLAAAMLRSQGIPTKVIFGYVSPDDLYHAWNMFYTGKTGWVTVSYEVKDGWNRLDLTFSAGGAGASFVGDGTNYADLYSY